MKNKKIISFFIVMVMVGVGYSADKTRAYLPDIEWYPRNENKLNSLLNRLFQGVPKTDILKGKKIVGLIAPHAGFTASGHCAAWGYRQLENLGSINRVILLGVSHQGNFHGACVSDFSHNATPLGKIAVDRSIVKKLAGEKNFRVNNRIMQYEHSLENQLPFLQRVLRNGSFKIVPILFGYLNREDFSYMAAIIRKYVDDKTLIVASSDFTHFGAPFGYLPFRQNIKENITKLDMGMIKSILRLDFDDYFKYQKKTGITMCGFFPVGVLLRIFSADINQGFLVNYYKSGDLSGSYQHSVSYAAIIFSERSRHNSQTESVEKKKNVSLKLTENEKKVLLELARETLLSYLSTGVFPEGLLKSFVKTEILEKKAGVFVTLKKHDELRGCIGNIIGVKPLYRGVMDNAINAAVNDHRFPSLKKSELKAIEIEISVMTPLEKIFDYKKIRLGIDGVIIKKHHNQAVYLPQVAEETGWDLSEFLGHLCLKAGLPADEYKSADMEFYIFQALVFAESQVK